MVLIKFQNGSDWCHARWVFAQVMADLSESVPEDSNLHSSLKKANDIGALFINRMETVAAGQMLRALKTTAENRISGRLKSWNRTSPRDENGHTRYLETIATLLTLVDRQLTEMRTEKET